MFKFSQATHQAVGVVGQELEELVQDILGGGETLLLQQNLGENKGKNTISNIVFSFQK